MHVRFVGLKADMSGLYCNRLGELSHFEGHILAAHDIHGDRDAAPRQRAEAIGIHRQIVSSGLQVGECVAAGFVGLRGKFLRRANVVNFRGGARDNGAGGVLDDSSNRAVKNLGCCRRQRQPKRERLLRKDVSWISPLAMNLASNDPGVNV